MTHRSTPAGPHRRRRAILLAVAVVILLGMSPILGHHLAGAAGRLPPGADHLGVLCVVALHTLLRPVHDLFQLLLAAGLAFAAWDRLRARRFLRHTVDALAWRAARAAGLDPALVRVAPGLPLPAFTAGWLRPRVYLAAELAQRLSPQQLAAVVAHEAAHVARRDPLCLCVLHFLGTTLFWIPVLRRLTRDCADEAEFLADDAARRGEPLVLASAILALAEWVPAPPPHLGVGVHHPDLLARRVRRLAGHTVAPRSHVTRTSLAGAVSVLVLVWTTGAVMAHPLHAASADPVHCQHAGSPAWSHLFCVGPTPHPAPTPCPHPHA